MEGGVPREGGVGERQALTLPQPQSVPPPPLPTSASRGQAQEKRRGTSHMGPTAHSHPPPNTFHPRLPKGPRERPGARGCALGDSPPLAVS